MLQEILGTKDPAQFFVFLFFALIGVVISLLIHSTSRDKNSMRTPYKFSFAFLIDDNWQRVLLNLLLILVTIRFCKEITGIPINKFLALSIGVAYDKIGEWLKNKCVIDKKDPQ